MEASALSGANSGRSQADIPPAGGVPADAAYARNVRARTRLTQAQFAASIGVPIDTVRNWDRASARRAVPLARSSR